jgi:hypothetical protein
MERKTNKKTFEKKGKKFIASTSLELFSKLPPKLHHQSSNIPTLCTKFQV